MWWRLRVRLESVLCCMLLVGGTAYAQIPGEPSGWQLIFEDNFNGTSLDTTKWNTGYGWGNYFGNGSSQESCSAANAIVQNGLLRLKLENIPRDGKLYTSAAVNSKNKFYQEYGYWEARLKIPYGRGFHPAFWAKRNNEDWPPEVDIMAMRGAETTCASMYVHWNQGWGDLSTGTSWYGPDFSAGFHDFGWRWTPTENIFYIDGVERYRTSQGAAYVTMPFYMMLSVQIGDQFAGYPDSSTPWPAYMEVDWVRVYRHTDLTCALTAPAAGSTVSGTVSVNVNAASSSNVTLVEVYRDGILVGSDAMAPYQVSWDTSSVSNGAHNLQAKAYDGASAVVYSSTISVNVANIDTTPPSVAITSPASGSSVSGTVTVTATASDNVGISRCELHVDGALVATHLTEPHSSASFSWNTASLSNASHTLQAKAIDAAGNVGQSALVGVVVSNTITSIAARSTWKYNDSGANLGTFWRSRTYSDSLWRSGAGILGYGESYINTVLRKSSRITTYFRKTITVNNPATLTHLTARIMVDDGFVLYINGTEVRRASLPIGAIGYNTIASEHEASNQYVTYNLDGSRSLLVQGSNVIAVEVHQASTASSDLVFDAELLLVGGSAGDAIPPGSGSGTFEVIEPLTLDRTALAPGETITGHVKYRNNSSQPVTLSRLLIAVRGPSEQNYDMSPEITNLTVASGEIVDLTASRTIPTSAPTGQWSAWDTWLDSSGGWHWSARRYFSVDPSIEPAPVPSPVPSPGVPQPRVTYARPAGGQWMLAFDDEFDGTGGTAADAHSGVNFVNKTVGGGSLSGNPGLNPRKWNMGWQTGPSTVNGLGMVTTPTMWGSSQTQWWGAESIVFPGDGTIRLRSQRRSWNGKNNEMGMITTAGLYACNPANSSHGSVPADRFIDGPQIVEWKASGTYIVDWPAMWMTNGGNFGYAGSQWPGGTSYSEEIDLVEPIFRLHAASEFQAGKQVVPSGWNGNDLLTWTWYFDAARIILWVTNESGITVKMFDIPDSQVSAWMISAQWQYPQYLMFAQQSTSSDAADGDMVIHYVRIWN
ncbi:MAG: family 16 glycosylhydrolase [Planctomycetes bacterium]|nr:family 16 glycosylhydrolase [Planctomycetota bacterium]